MVGERNNKMAEHKIKLFTPTSDEGKKFIKLWNKADRDGIQKKIVKELNISISMVYKIRKKLNLPDLHSKHHPGRRKLIKRIIKHYWNGKSTRVISKIYDMSQENIRIILINNNVDMKPRYSINPLYFSFKNKSMTHNKTLKMIKRLYVDEKMSAADIAKKLNLDQGAVSKKLKAMNIVLRQNHRNVKGGYPCQWCGKIMDKVWQNKGPRKQKFCCGSCKNRAKDYRRMIKGERFSSNRVNMMNSFLLETWGSGFDVQVKKLLEVRRI